MSTNVNQDKTYEIKLWLREKELMVINQALFMYRATCIKGGSRTHGDLAKELWDLIKEQIEEQNG